MSASGVRGSEAVESYAGKSALVLGASGFIGRWIARELSRAGARVTLAVRDPETAGPIFTRWGAAGEIVRADLTDLEAVRQLFRRTRPTITFNLAGYGVDRTERDDALAWQINDALVATVCEGVAETVDRTWRGLHIVHTGSALEYGAIGGNLNEDAVPNPTTTYGQSKLAGTRTLARGCAAEGLRGVTARLFTVYGPGEHAGRLVPSLIEGAVSGAPFPLSEGLQRRDFTYVEDVVDGLLRLGVRGIPMEVLNLATGKLATVRDFIEVAARILRIPSANLRFGALPTRPEEMEHA
ncbi:MAG: NAD-dependent epimerase/dehydratase family protein, partial [Gemmatimonadota bacterium]